MKKIILTVIGSLVLGMTLSLQAYSVVPSPISMEEGGAFNQEGVARSTSSRNVGQVADKLAEDERRLHNVLQDLEKDSKDLKRSSSTTGSETLPGNSPQTH